MGIYNETGKFILKRKILIFVIEYILHVIRCYGENICNENEKNSVILFTIVIQRQPTTSSEGMICRAKEQRSIIDYIITNEVLLGEIKDLRNYKS